MVKIGYICPTYKAKELDSYTRLALSSFFATTPNGVAIVVDDGSSSWSFDYEESLRQVAPGKDIRFKHFSSNGGLTRSWNFGLAEAESSGIDYVIAGNNDIIFTENWYKGMLHALDNGFELVGPVSNAPGITAKKLQQIDYILPEYQNTDNIDQLNSYARQLYSTYLGHVIESSINGFFQLAKLESWVKGKFDSQHFYRPINFYNSKGKKNATPLMTLNEDELQSRWKKLGMRSAICLSSFIFHYRAVTRGDKYKRGNWFRQCQK